MNIPSGQAIVQFFNTTSSGSDELGRVVFDFKTEKITSTGEAVADLADLDDWKTKGISDPKKPAQTKKLKDGLSFLELLHKQYSGSYVRASAAIFASP